MFTILILCSLASICQVKKKLFFCRYQIQIIHPTIDREKLGNTQEGRGLGQDPMPQIYLFIAPAVRPEIICLWKNRNTMITGKADKLEAAKR